MGEEKYTSAASPNLLDAIDTTDSAETETRPVTGFGVSREKRAQVFSWAAEQCFKRWGHVGDVPWTPNHTRTEVYETPPPTPPPVKHCRRGHGHHGHKNHDDDHDGHHEQKGSKEHHVHGHKGHQHSPSKLHVPHDKAPRQSSKGRAGQHSQ